MEALILIDIQNDYFKGGKYPLKGMKKAAENATGLLEQFRKNNKPVIHVQHISKRKPILFFANGTAGAEIHHSVTPIEGEKVFVKHYPNAFRDTPLDEYLKSLRVSKLRIAGAMTNMCIDSTVRAGFDLGYKIIIHKKACAAPGVLGTAIIHEISIKTIGSVFARIEK